MRAIRICWKLLDTASLITDLEPMIQKVVKIIDAFLYMQGKISFLNTLKSKNSHIDDGNGAASGAAAFATYLHGIEFPRTSCSKFKKTGKGKCNKVCKPCLYQILDGTGYTRGIMVHYNACPLGHRKQEWQTTSILPYWCQNPYIHEFS